MIKILDNSDLFDYTSFRVPVHCISADHAMGAGIAVPIARMYGLYASLRNVKSNVGDVHYVNGVMNMITKKFCYQKPTQEDFLKTLHNLHAVCIKENTYRLVMPAIGCGIDRLDWTWVYNRINDIFGSDDKFDVLICLDKPRPLNQE